MHWLTFCLVPLWATAQMRIDPSHFQVPEREIHHALHAAVQLFPKQTLPPLFITRSHNGPITFYEKNARGEIIIQLNTQGRYWSQYLYQFAHELTHVRAGFRPDGQENKWFEETLCEVASLYTLRQLSTRWRENPPLPAWQGYHHSLHQYAQKVIESRENLALKDLPAFYQKHRATLRKDAKTRPLNGAMAVALLPLFEQEPSRWLSLQFLNQTPAKPQLSLHNYLGKWHRDSPEKHRPFIKKLQSLFLPNSSRSETLPQ